MSDITNLMDAKIAKRMGIPLTTAFEHCKASRAVEKHWAAFDKSHKAYQKALDRFIERQSSLRFKNLTIELNRFHRIALAADAYVGKIKGDDNGFEADKSAMILCEMCQRSDAIYFWWYNLIDLVKEGQTQFDLADCPRFYNDEAA